MKPAALLCAAATLLLLLADTAGAAQDQGSCPIVDGLEAEKRAAFEAQDFAALPVIQEKLEAAKAAKAARESGGGDPAADLEALEAEKRAAFESQDYAALPAIQAKIAAALAGLAGGEAEQAQAGDDEENSGLAVDRMQSGKEKMEERRAQARDAVQDRLPTKAQLDTLGWVDTTGDNEGIIVPPSWDGGTLVLLTTKGDKMSGDVDQSKLHRVTQKQLEAVGLKWVTGAEARAIIGDGDKYEETYSWKPTGNPRRGSPWTPKGHGWEGEDGCEFVGSTGEALLKCVPAVPSAALCPLHLPAAQHCCPPRTFLLLGRFSSSEQCVPFVPAGRCGFSRTRPMMMSRLDTWPAGFPKGRSRWLRHQSSCGMTSQTTGLRAWCAC